MGNIARNLRGLKYILAGLALMAVSTALVEVLFLFKPISLLNWGEAFIHLIGWVLVVFGMLKEQNIRIEFRRGFLVSIVGLVMTILQIALAAKVYATGLVEMVFIDIYVMFAEYLANLSMLAVYFFVIRGMAQLLAKFGFMERASKCNNLLKIGFIVVLCSFIVTPFAYIFPLIIKFILALISISAGVVMQVAMIWYVDLSYKEITQ